MPLARRGAGPGASLRSGSESVIAVVASVLVPARLALGLAQLMHKSVERACLIDKLLRVGWGGLTAEETGRIGGLTRDPAHKE